MINPTTHAISEFSAGLNQGSNLQQGLVASPDGNLWFSDPGTTRAVGMIDPTTHAISEFSSGLNPAASRALRSWSARTALCGSRTAAPRRRSGESTRPRT
jgi:streptogramin lyase